MRRTLLLALVAASLIPASGALAQQRRPGSNTGQDDQAEAAKKRQRDSEFEEFQAPLPGQRAATF